MKAARKVEDGQEFVKYYEFQARLRESGSRLESRIFWKCCFCALIFHFKISREDCWEMAARRTGSEELRLSVAVCSCPSAAASSETGLKCSKIALL